MKFVIVTPAKNEQEFISNTIESVINQTRLPEEWIIVDDGSTDNTIEIIDEYSKKFAWIKPVKYSTENEQRSGGVKVVKVFYQGYKNISIKNYDYIVKLDADLTLPSNYFEEVSNAFLNDVNLGLCGGYCVNIIDGIKIAERSDTYHIRGAFKSVRKSCFDQIGGFKPIWNWDGLDEMTALYQGWKTKTLDLPVIHHRYLSQAYDPVKHSFKSGYESYRMGSSILLTIFRVFVRLKWRPYFFVSFSDSLKGYIKARKERPSMYINDDLAAFIRKFHYNRIIKRYS